MSFFDSDYVYTGYSFTQPMFTEVTKEAQQKKLLVETILKDNGESIGDAIIRDLFNNRGQVFSKAFNYLQANHPQLIRDFEYQGNVLNYDETGFESYLGGLEGETVSVESVNYGIMYLTLETIYYYLQEKHGYNSVTRELINTPLNDQYSTVTLQGDPELLLEWGGDWIARAYLSAGGQSHTWDIPLHRLEEVMPSKPNEWDNWIWITYTLPNNSAAGTKYLVLVDDGTVESPEYENVGTVASNILPSVYFRLANTDLSGDPAATNHAAYKGYARILGVDYEEIGEEVNNQEDQPSNQVANNISLEIGVSALSENTSSVHYLMEYFSHQLDGVGGFLFNNKTDYEAILAGRGQGAFGTSPPAPSTKLGSADKILRVTFIDRRTVSGTLGTVGATESIHTPGEIFTWSDTSTEKIDTGTLLLRRQVAANLIEEIEVGGLASAESIGMSKGGHQYTIRHFFSDVVEAESDELIVPLDLDAFNALLPQYRKVVSQQAYYLRVGGYTETEVQWYQKADFLNFVEFIGAVLFLTGLGSTVKAFLQLVGKYGLVQAVIITVVVSQVAQIALTELVQLIAKEFGSDVAAIFAAVAAVVLVAYGQFAQNPLLSADKLLQLANGLLQGASTANQEAMEDLARKNERRQTEAEKLQEELDKVLKDLAPKVELDPWVLGRIDPLWIPGETSDEFFARTVHSGNIGAVGIEAVHNYVKMALTLPKTPKLDKTDLWGI